MKRSEESVHLLLDNKYCYSGAGTPETVYKINFRHLLGDMYDKYPKFKMVVNSFMNTNSTSAAAVSGYEVKAVTIRMTGLDWYNSSYSTINPIGTVVAGTGTAALTNNLLSGGNTSEACLPSFVSVLQSNTTLMTFIDYNGICFNRPTSDTVDLKVFFRDIRVNSIPPKFSTEPANQFLYVLSLTIYGLYN